jgi:hypothetical protein
MSAADGMIGGATAPRDAMRSCPGYEYLRHSAGRVVMVEQVDCGYFVIGDGKPVAGPFATHAQAWRWIDRNEGEPISRSELVSEWFFGNDE